MRIHLNCYIKNIYIHTYILCNNLNVNLFIHLKYTYKICHINTYIYLQISLYINIFLGLLREIIPPQKDDEK